MLCDKPFEVPQNLLEKMQGIEPIHMAVAGAASAEVLQSVKAGLQHKIFKPLLVGDGKRLEALLKEAGIDGADVEIHHAQEEEDMAAMAVSLVRAGKAEALLKGDIHTHTLLKGVLNKEKGLRTGRRLSHVFHMSVPGEKRPLYITDAVINVAPDLDTLTDIIVNGARMARFIGEPKPKVAMLSASEVPSPGLPSSLLAEQAAQKSQEILGDEALVQGPLAFDLAISPKAAQQKRVTGAVAGHADIIAVPNIETGNSLFKMMVYFMSATAAGLVMGASCPVALTSRADPPEARLASAMMCALVARNQS